MTHPLLDPSNSFYSVVHDSWWPVDPEQIRQANQCILGQDEIRRIVRERYAKMKDVPAGEALFTPPTFVVSRRTRSKDDSAKAIHELFDELEANGCSDALPYPMPEGTPANVPLMVVSGPVLVIFAPHMDSPVSDYEMRIVVKSVMTRGRKPE